jgi:predicted metal-dependent hydrolase
MTVADLDIEVIQKDIKNIHLAVYPPIGRVRIAAPLEVNTETIRLFILSKLPWIRRQQRKFANQNRQTLRQYVNRETHYYLGRKYLLRVHETNHPYRYPKVVLKTKTYIDLYVKENTSIEQKANLMKEWYREELKKILVEYIVKWEKILNVKANVANVKSMKTKWGSCNTDKGTILFNLELAKKPLSCIEYVVAHELVHLIERLHNDNFRAYLDKHLPNWKQIKSELNLHTTAHIDWDGVK